MNCLRKQPRMQFVSDKWRYKMEENFKKIYN